MEKKGRGYKGKSMSVNAAIAYSEGKKPLSKWTKSAIFDEMDFYCDEISAEKMELLKKLTVKELHENFLSYKAYHHTGKFYNTTNFYELNIEKIEEITIDEINNIISRRKKAERRSQEVINAEKAEKAKRKAEKEALEEKTKLFKYQNKYKTLKGFLKSTSIDLETLKAIRLKKIEEKREQLRKGWEKQGYIYGLKSINNDDFIESYIRQRKTLPFPVRWCFAPDSILGGTV